MALKAGRKKPGRTAQRTGPGKFVVGAGVLASVFLITILAFISPPMAVLASGLIALAAFMGADNRRRFFWEAAASDKFRIIEDNHDDLAREVARNTHHISLLREDIAETAQSIKKQVFDDPQEDPYQLIEQLRAPAGRPGLLGRLRSPVSAGPRATKPGKTKPKAEYVDPRLNDYDGLSDTVVRELIQSAIQSESINVFAQPIVRLPQRQVRFLEMYARIRARPGMYIPAQRYMTLAQKENMINAIDRLLLMECLQTIKKTEYITKAVPMFINVTTATLKNAVFMNQLITFLAKNRNLAPRLVFEIRQRDLKNMQPAILEILRGLGKLGCALSIDHVETFDFDLKFLQVLKVRFVKLDARALLARAQATRGATDIWKLKRVLEGNGIGVIVEKIENETVLRDLLDFDS